MEFRSPIVAAQQNAKATAYLTDELGDPGAGRAVVQDIIDELGSVVERHPYWHPILTLPPRRDRDHVTDLSQLDAYRGIDHTVRFVRGFVTCPYSSDVADALVHAVNAIPGLEARRLKYELYADTAHPVMVSAETVLLDDDGTIRSRDAIAWFTQASAAKAGRFQRAETWWTMRGDILGSPRGSRSSLCVSQHAGMHMRKILEAMNASGMFGPVIEDSLDMIPQRKRDAINRNLIRAAFTNWDGKVGEFELGMNGETFRVRIRDVWGDGTEISVQMNIGDFDLVIAGHYHPKEDRVSASNPRGKRALAVKFI